MNLQLDRQSHGLDNSKYQVMHNNSDIRTMQEGASAVTQETF